VCVCIFQAVSGIREESYTEAVETLQQIRYTRFTPTGLRLGWLSMYYGVKRIVIMEFCYLLLT